MKHCKLCNVVIAASDLVLAVRYGRSPGAENGRPLEHVGGLFWRIDDDYLKAFDGK